MLHTICQVTSNIVLEAWQIFASTGISFLKTTSEQLWRFSWVNNHSKTQTPQPCRKFWKGHLAVLCHKTCMRSTLVQVPKTFKVRFTNLMLDLKIVLFFFFFFKKKGDQVLKESFIGAGAAEQKSSPLWHRWARARTLRPHFWSTINNSAPVTLSSSQN